MSFSGSTSRGPARRPQYPDSRVSRASRAPLAPLAALLALVAVAAGGQGLGVSPAVPAAPGSGEGLSSYTFTLRHQPTDEALALVRPLLSVGGSIDLQADGRTLVIRDSLPALSRIVPLLRGFDHPAAAVRLRVQLVQAGPMPLGLATTDSQLEGRVVERLRRLLRFESYTLLSETRIEAHEGDQVAYEFRAGYRVEFRLGTVLAAQRLKLHGFRVVRGPASGGGKELIHTSVNLPLAQPFILGLTRDEGSRTALLVVLVYEPAEGS